MAITAIMIAAFGHALKGSAEFCERGCRRAAAFLFAEARSKGLRGSLDRSEGERRAARRPADQPESEGKRPSGQTLAQRDKKKEK